MLKGAHTCSPAGSSGGGCKGSLPKQKGERKWGFSLFSGSDPQTMPRFNQANGEGENGGEGGGKVVV